MFCDLSMFSCFLVVSSIGTFPFTVCCLGFFGFYHLVGVVVNVDHVSGRKKEANAHKYMSSAAARTNKCHS